jgi:sugar diacid utilization regulator
MIRQEESARRQFVDDLLRVDTDVARLIERAEPFGLDLGRNHQVLLAAPVESSDRLDLAVVMERVIVNRFGDRDVLIAIKDDLLVMLIPGEVRDALSGRMVPEPAACVHTGLSRHAAKDRWQIAAGRPYTGADGIARSYEEAREALLLARRLHLDQEVIQARDLLVYRVLGRDQAALVDLIRDSSNRSASRAAAPSHCHRRWGPTTPTGGVATETARRLHMSVLTVPYRLAKVKT